MNFMILIPNFITACNLFAGLAGMAMASQGHIETAAWLVIASVVFDGVDGKIATWLELESEFGRWFDALADWIAFGVLPAMIIIFSNTQIHGGWLWAVAIFYALSALFRLIRFNLTSKQKIKSTAKSKRFFRGLPTTASAAFFASLYLTMPFHQMPEMFQIAILLALAILMMSDVRYYNPRVLVIHWLKKASGLQRFIFIGGFFLLIWVSCQVPMLIFWMFIIYIVSGIADLHERLDVMALKDLQ